MKARINDIEIEYEEFGSGPAVLFLHDYASNRDVPSAQIKALTAAGYRVISTHLGSIGEGPLESFEPAGRAGDAVALFNYLGIGRAVVFGISRGGLVLLELMEKFPGRVAAGSLVLSSASVREVRQLAKRPEMRQALREGRLEELKAALTASLVKKNGEKRALTVPAPLRQLLQSLCSRRGQSHRQGGGDRLADLAIPPITITGEGSEQALPAKPSIASRGWRKIKGINLHLAALLDFLLPGDEGAEDEEILTGQM